MIDRAMDNGRIHLLEDSLEPSYVLYPKANALVMELPVGLNLRSARLARRGLARRPEPVLSQAFDVDLSHRLKRFDLRGRRSKQNAELSSPIVRELSTTYRRDRRDCGLVTRFKGRHASYDIKTRWSGRQHGFDYSSYRCLFASSTKACDQCVKPHRQV